ncbi:hypothetical protein B0I35DRAFT_515506 [Stachybotrys elegans]|uniref:Cytochrome P450 n=1 Tax=Stachybotrys elegans TaxID=80388 RepID=A0A8K0SN19_9HYPO|nr:hypothetical protein B0I35DRAFT_515506 [Stachybotrys elegans]
MEWLHEFSVEYLLVPLALYAAYLLSILLYNAYFHPLARFPDPFWWGATPIPYTWYQLTGRLPFVFSKLHDQHVDVDICQIRPKQKLLAKDPYAMSPNHEGVYNILTTFEPVEHAIFGAQLNPVFSARALREQEPIIMSHVDKLI